MHQFLQCSSRQTILDLQQTTVVKEEGPFIRPTLKLFQAVDVVLLMNGESLSTHGKEKRNLLFTPTFLIHCRQQVPDDKYSSALLCPLFLAQILFVSFSDALLCTGSLRGFNSSKFNLKEMIRSRETKNNCRIGKRKVQRLSFISFLRQLFFRLLCFLQSGERKQFSPHWLLTIY